MRWRTVGIRMCAYPESLPPLTLPIMHPIDATLPHRGALTRSPHSGFSNVGNDECGSLIFDGGGRICGSGAAADSLFGAGQGRIIGRLISEFITDIRPDGSPTGGHAQAPAALCEKSDWQGFEAADALGRSFAIAIHLSRRMTNGREVYVLNFRRPGQGLFSPPASKVPGEIVHCQDWMRVC